MDEVAVFPDRLEVRSEGAWKVFPFAEMPGGASKPPVLLGLGGMRPRVADLLYVREPYSESYFRFYTDPPVTVYMPADGPALSPHSAFWRVLQALKRGGYYADDADYAQELFEIELRKRSLWLRVIGPFLYRLAILNFFLMIGTMIVLRGNALQGQVIDDHYYLGSKPRGAPVRHREVSRDVWMFSYVTTIGGLSAPVLGVAGHLLVYGFHSARLKRVKAKR